MENVKASPESSQYADGIFRGSSDNFSSRRTASTGAIPGPTLSYDGCEGVKTKAGLVMRWSWSWTLIVPRGAAIRRRRPDQLTGLGESRCLLTERGVAALKKEMGSVSLVIMGSSADILQVIDLHGRLAAGNHQNTAWLGGRTAWGHLEGLDCLVWFTTVFNAKILF